MKFEVSIFGDTQVKREIVRRADRVKDARPLWRNLSDLMEKRLKRQFITQGKYASGGWAPLKPETVKRKRRAGASSKILQFSGELMRSLTERSGSAVRVFKKKEMRFGSKLKYGGFHQKGTEDMPMRKPAEFTEATKKEMVKRFQRFVLTGELID